MNQSKNRLAIILFYFLIILLFIPLIFVFFPALKGKPLNGVSKESDTIIADSISWTKFVKGSAQVELERSFKSNIGFSNTWIRLINELNYRAFRYTDAEKLVLGKDDFFYEEMYITEYLGRNFIGDTYLQKKIKSLKKLQQILKDQYDVTLLLVFEPGKAHFSPEQIPERYHPEIKSTSNYERLLHYCKAEQVDFLDLNHYFSEQKEKSPHLLYSKYGVHWSTYGLWMAADTLSHFIENQCNIKLPHFVQVGDSSSRNNNDLDFDMEPSMNLFCQLPHETMYFPINQFISDSHDTKPQTLTIADSYYWSFISSGIASNLFTDNTFWYYNKAVYPHIWEGDLIYADKSKLKQVIENQDLILLMITDANLYNFGWNFIEEALAALDPTYVEDVDITVLNWIMNDKNWYSSLLLKSQRERIKFEDIVYQTVEYEKKQMKK